MNTNLGIYKRCRDVIGALPTVSFNLKNLSFISIIILCFFFCAIYSITLLFKGHQVINLSFIIITVNNNIQMAVYIVLNKLSHTIFWYQNCFKQPIRTNVITSILPMVMVTSKFKQPNYTEYFCKSFISVAAHSFFHKFFISSTL